MELRSRHITEQAALALQGAVLLSDDTNPLAQAFCNTRLSNACGLTFGTLARDTNFDDIIAFASIMA
jgi:putative acyl-CoA dehydrogenase